MPSIEPITRQKAAQWEGDFLYVYDDGGGVATAGRGHTKGLTRAMLGQKITQAQSDAWYEEDLQDAANEVDSFVHVPLTPNQRAALQIFDFNVGPTQFGGSTLVRELNEGNYADVPAQLLRWVYDNGKYVKGLDNRRHDEVAVWLAGSPPVNPIYPTGSRTINGAATAAAGGAADVAVQVQQAAPTVMPSDNVGDVVNQVQSTAEQAAWHFSSGNLIMMAIGAVILAGAAWALYARWDDAGRPLPWKRKPLMVAAPPAPTLVLPPIDASTGAAPAEAPAAATPPTPPAPAA